MLSLKISPSPSPYSSPRTVTKASESEAHCEPNDFSAEASAQIESKKIVLSFEENQHCDAKQIQIFDDDERKMLKLMDKSQEMAAKYFGGERDGYWGESIRTDTVMLTSEEKSSFQTTTTSSTTLTLNAVAEIISPLTERSSGTRSFFDTKLPSAFKVIDPQTAKEILRSQINRGWRWVSKEFISLINDKRYDSKKGYFTTYRVIAQDTIPTQSDISIFDEADIVLLNQVGTYPGIEGPIKCFFYLNNEKKLSSSFCSSEWNTNDLNDFLVNHLIDLELPSNPVLKARQMPFFGKGDWIVMEGKTMRWLKASTEDWHEFEEAFQNNRETIFLADNREIGELQGWCLPPNFFEDNSYARIAGAYIRHLERLPKLQKLFSKFFETEEITETFQVGLFEQTLHKYYKYKSIRLNTDVPVSKEDLSDLGIPIDQHKISANPTIENTIPFKKVLEILTCFDPVQYHDCPWRVSLKLLGKERSFSLSAGKYSGDTKQVIVSMYDSTKNVFIGSSYSWYTPYECLWNRKCFNKINAETVDQLLEGPLSESTAENYYGDIILEFAVCTQVAEAHVTLGSLTESRVPGTGKQARAIFRYHKDIGPSLLLRSSFDGELGGTRVFPMSGAHGTGNTRAFVSKLMKQDKKAPCTDMSEDSELEEIKKGKYISGEGT
ncbi:MAG: hypothetical protein K0R08_652 [Solimicrobium sp.]|jgi:hypothetical protein|nr:hypothetical protein [Solimicrobium sp.]